MKDNIKYGWSCFGLVEFKREWCEICARARWQETIEWHTVCLACCNVTQPPKFQIERFLRGG